MNLQRKNLSNVKTDFMESVTFDRFATVTHQPNVKVKQQMNNCEFQIVKENMRVLFRTWRYEPTSSSVLPD